MVTGLIIMRAARTIVLEWRVGLPENVDLSSLRVTSSGPKDRPTAASEAEMPELCLLGIQS